MLLHYRLLRLTHQKTFLVLEKPVQICTIYYYFVVAVVIIIILIFTV